MKVISQIASVIAAGLGVSIAGHASAAAYLSYDARVQGDAFVRLTDSGTDPLSVGVHNQVADAIAAVDYGAIKIATAGSASLGEYARGDVNGDWYDKLTVTSASTGSGYFLGTFEFNDIVGGSYTAPLEHQALSEQQFWSQAYATINVGSASAAVSVSDINRRHYNTSGHSEISEEIFTSYATGFDGGGYEFNYNVYNGEITALTGIEFNPSQSYTIKVPFTVGQVVNFHLGMYCFTTASNGAQGYCDMSHSGYWRGITGVFDADGNPLSDFDITSQSGFDFVAGYPRATVPEPGTDFGTGAHGLRSAAAASAVGPSARPLNVESRFRPRRRQPRA
jgi:hypothetical protein